MKIKTQEKRNSGITLIALVITIIILLILAAVSIATLIGENGIITQARNAKEQTEIAAVIEKARVDILGEQVENNADIAKEEINKIIAQYDKDKKIRVDKGIAYIITDNGYEIKVSDIWNGTTYLVGDVLKINPDAETSERKSPYVKYNGLDCRVLYNDETHGAQIITAESVCDVTLGADDPYVNPSMFSYDGSLTLNDNFKKAAASYNNAVNNLNKRAKTYMDTKGITTDARCLGSIPTLNSTSKFQSDTSEMWSGTETYLTTYRWNNKFKASDDNYSEDVKQLNDLGLNVSSGVIWLASRYHNYDEGGDMFVRTISSNGFAGGCERLLYAGDNGLNLYSYSESAGFRPVFLLPSNVVISGGNGSSENPYVIE